MKQEFARAVAALLKSRFPGLGTDDELNGGDAVGGLADLYAELSAEGGGAGVEERERELLRADDGFCDLVLREAEAQVLHAPIDDVVVFAYGGWAEAQAAWRRRQRSRFRRPRRPRRLKVKAA
jgi:hypothetical protein